MLVTYQMLKLMSTHLVFHLDRIWFPWIIEGLLLRKQRLSARDMSGHKEEVRITSPNPAFSNDSKEHSPSKTDYARKANMTNDSKH